jgi:hypothetical protein
MKIARSFNCGFDGIKTHKPRRGDRISRNVLSAAPPGLDLLGGVFPQLKLRAIFGCPCGTKPPPQTELERFVKFKPQTPLREIIQLTASL